jgi:putative ABC transport system ATP-binding protein
MDEPNSDPALELIDVTVERGGKRVLEDIDLSVATGKTTALVGPSGASKSSLLRCMNGLDRPVEGSIRVAGLDISDIDPRELRRRVGMIFQVPVVFPGTVGDNLAYGFDAFDRTAGEGALQTVGLDASFFDRSANALSVGQGQRVCIARALLREPDVLLMDEPTSSLDRDAAAVIERLVKQLKDSGLTVVFVTHDLEQARRVADSAALLVDGRLRYFGHPDSIHELWEEHA